MKKRYTYCLLFGVPGFCLSLLISFFFFGSVSGFLWIYVFGDNPWPSWVVKALPLLFGFAFLVMWFAFLIAGFRYGRKREDLAGLDGRHIAVAVGTTVVVLVLGLLHQVRVGNIGPKTDSALCSDFCREKGFSASSMPPKISGDRTCSCLDDLGGEVLKIPLESLVSIE